MLPFSPSRKFDRKLQYRHRVTKSLFLPEEISEPLIHSIRAIERLVFANSRQTDYGTAAVLNVTSLTFAYSLLKLLITRL